MEIILGSSLAAFAPLAVSSATATLLTWAAFGRDPVFHVPAATLSSPWEIALYAALGVLGGVVGALFLFALRACAAFYSRSGLPRPVAMATAGLASASSPCATPTSSATAGKRSPPSSTAPGASSTSWPCSCCGSSSPRWRWVGDGGRGLHADALPRGHARARLRRGGPGLAPTLGADPAAFALAGMGILLAGTTHAPLTAVVMVFEMTLDYGIVVPLLLGSAVASLVATRLSVNSVYTEALQRKAGEGEAHGALDVLRVADLVRRDQVTVASDLPLSRVLDAFVASRRGHLYVVDERAGSSAR